MKFSKFKKFKHWKIALIILIAVVFLGVGSVEIAHAAWFDLENIAAKGLGWAAYAMGYIAGFIAAAIFSIGGFLINMALGLNKAILADGSIVHVGWPIVLGFANLGFVLAIIIIAFATIFRKQSYAMKQTLWKLIVAALLVNFSLVIAGAFINVADIATEIFISKSMPQGFTDFSQTLASMFKAQQYLKAAEIQNAKTSGITEFGGALLGLIAQVFFMAAFTFIGALTLLAIAIMLIIRYVVLAILLILSPLVWLLWIFPGTQTHWQKWWNEFLRWTFFAPVIFFFLYLTIIAMKNYPEYADKIIEVSETATESGRQVSFSFIKNSVIGNLAIVTGLMIGGLLAANSLGITFGSTAFGWAQKTGKMFGGWVGRRGIQGGTALLRTDWGKKAIQGMEKFGATSKKGVGAALQRLATRPIRSLMGQPLSRLAAIGGEKAVTDAGKKFEGYDDWRLAQMIYSLNAPERVAALQHLRRNKNLDLLPDTRDFVNEKTQKEFAAYSQPAPDYRALRRTAGFDEKMLEAFRAGDENKLKDAAIEFYKGFKPEYFNRMQVDDFFKKDASFGFDEEGKAMLHRAVIPAILEANPDGLSNVYRGLKGKTIENFNDYLFDFLDEKRRGTSLTRRQWLEQDKATYGSLLTFLNSSAAKGLGIDIDKPRKEEEKSTPFSTA